jgi:hypothetical protein
MMGHRDFKTTLIYADYAPSEREAERVEQAFRTRWSTWDSRRIAPPSVRRDR